MGTQSGGDAAEMLEEAAFRSNHATSCSIGWVRFVPPMSCPNGREWTAAVVEMAEEEGLGMLR
jgi:hypothetical protein